MNHAAGNRSTAEVHRRGAKLCYKGSVHGTKVLWRFCLLKQSIRAHSIVITPRESWHDAVYTSVAHMLLLSIPFLCPFCQAVSPTLFSSPSSSSIIVFPPLPSSPSLVLAFAVLPHFASLLLKVHYCWVQILHSNTHVCTCTLPRCRLRLPTG